MVWQCWISCLNLLSIILDQCCYFYGSAPRNDSNCVPEGDQLPLNCIIYNPRDIFSNLSVQWFRSRNMSALAEGIAPIPSTEYTFLRQNQRNTSLQRNCTQGTLYADTFALIINNFTTDKNGYYWCQILINDSFTLPSQSAWFYANESTSCIREDPYFMSVPDRAYCASGKSLANSIYSMINWFSLTTSPDNPTTTTMSTTPAMMSTLVLASENAVTYSEPILYYAVGILAMLVLLVGTLAILMLIFYAHKRQKEKRQRNREAIINLFITSMSMIQPHSQAMFPVF